VFHITVSPYIAPGIMVRIITSVLKMYRQFHSKKGKRPLGRRRYRWEDDSKAHIKGAVFYGVAWVQIVNDKAHWRALS
jgi:hypothetical protein